MEVDDEEDHGKHDEHHAGPVRRQYRQRIESEQQGHRAEDPGQPDAGVVKLEYQPEGPEQDQEVRNLGVGDRVKQPLEQVHLLEPQRHRWSPGVLIPCLECHGLRCELDLFTVELLEEIPERRRDTVHHVHLGRIRGPQ
jgi:hypothetical protein